MQGAECLTRTGEQYPCGCGSPNGVQPLAPQGTRGNTPYAYSTGFEALWDSMWKCRRGKMWKASVARFVLHGIEETLRLEQEIREGTYRPRKPKTFTLTYPKERPCSSTHIRDRIVQRSLNDNVIYPAMTRSFIWDNMACQNGKGTTRAMDRLNRLLRRYFINTGTNTGWVLQCDVHGYYRSMRHSDAEKCFRRRLDKETADHALAWLQRQYPGDVGYAPGSQMVQILGISLLDPMDHAIKEKLRAKYYLRYMDDFLIISRDREYLEKARRAIEAELAGFELHLHPEKTRIYPLTGGIKMLGFTFRLTKTGEVIRLIDPKNPKHERKKLYRMAQKTPEAKYWECYTSWKAHARLGKSWKLLSRMDKYAQDLMEDQKMQIIPKEIAEQRRKAEVAFAKATQETNDIMAILLGEESHEEGEPE